MIGPLGRLHRSVLVDRSTGAESVVNEVGLLGFQVVNYKLAWVAEGAVAALIALTQWDPRVAPLLCQPELPLILDRLEADPTGLSSRWPPTVPRIWLEALAEAWGRPF